VHIPPRAAQPCPAPLECSTPTRSRIPWDEVALVLGRGATVTQVAGIYGISRVTIWRRMRADDRFRRLVEETQADAQAEAAGQVEQLREDVARQLRRLVKAGNVRVVLWLARELGVVRRDYAGLLADITAAPSVFENAAFENAAFENATPEESSPLALRGAEFPTEKPRESAVFSPKGAAADVVPGCGNDAPRCAGVTAGKAKAAPASGRPTAARAASGHKVPSPRPLKPPSPKVIVEARSP